MPLPVRYSSEVPEMEELWSPIGYFRAQTSIWAAECGAMHDLHGSPSAAELEEIERALELSSEDLVELTRAEGHETNRLLRLVQGRLPQELGNLIHRGNTSSDVLDTSLSLQILSSLVILAADFEQLAGVLASLSFQYKDTVQVARTHGQHAIPQTFGRQV